MKKDEDENDELNDEDPEDSNRVKNKTLETIPDTIFTEALDLWCDLYKPAEKTIEHDTITMSEILEALNSLFGFNVEFSVIQVYTELKNRGYKISLDAASNQFKVIVRF